MHRSTTRPGAAAGDAGGWSSLRWVPSGERTLHLIVVEFRVDSAEVFGPGSSVSG
jgi:hypothetical protein